MRANADTKTKPIWRQKTERSLYSSWRHEARINGNTELERHYQRKLADMGDIKPPRQLTKQRTVFGGDMWLPDEDRQLLTLRSIGVSFNEIGRRVGRSKNSCISRHRRLTKAG